jgi:hypothetical protein
VRKTNWFLSAKMAKRTPKSGQRTPILQISNRIRTPFDEAQQVISWFHAAEAFAASRRGLIHAFT